MLCFSKNWFSKFSIDRTYCLTDRKCDKNLGYNLPGSIDAWLVLDWSKLIFDQSKFGLMVFLKAFSLICSSLYSTFQKAFCFLSLRPIHLKPSFCHFLPNFSQRILSSSAGMSFLSLPFLFIHIFHAFFMHNFRTYWILGFLNFGLFSFKLNH